MWTLESHTVHTSLYSESEDSRNRRKEIRENKMVCAVLCHLYSGSKQDLGLAKHRPQTMKTADNEWASERIRNWRPLASPMRMHFLSRGSLSTMQLIVNLSRAWRIFFSKLPVGDFDQISLEYPKFWMTRGSREWPSIYIRPGISSQNASTGSLKYGNLESGGMVH